MCFLPTSPRVHEISILKASVAVLNLLESFLHLMNEVVKETLSSIMLSSFQQKHSKPTVRGEAQIPDASLSWWQYFLI